MFSKKQNIDFTMYQILFFDFYKFLERHLKDFYH